MDTLHLQLAFGWVIYCLLHSLLASLRIKTIARNYLGKQFRYYRLIYSLLALLLLVPLVYFQLVISSPLLFHSHLISEYIALLLGSIGIVGIFVSLKKYISTPKGFNDLFFEGVKPKLQTQGLHGRVRHPIYLFTFLAIWSVFLYKPYLSILVVDCVITIYTLFAIRFEEQKLISLYGKEYEEYRKRVPMILPF